MNEDQRECVLAYKLGFLLSGKGFRFSTFAFNIFIVVVFLCADWTARCSK